MQKKITIFYWTCIDFFLLLLSNQHNTATIYIVFIMYDNQSRDDLKHVEDVPRSYAFCIGDLHFCRRWYLLGFPRNRRLSTLSGDCSAKCWFRYSEQALPIPPPREVLGLSLFYKWINWGKGRLKPFVLGHAVGLHRCWDLNGGNLTPDLNHFKPLTPEHASIFKPQCSSASHEGGVMKMSLIWLTDAALGCTFALLWPSRLPALSFPLLTSPLQQPHLCLSPESNPPA